MEVRYILGERLSLNIEVDSINYNLSFNIRTLKNIYKLTSISPFDFLTRFITCKDEEIIIYLNKIILSLSNLDISIDSLLKVVTEENKCELKSNIINFINAEMMGEIEVDKVIGDTEKGEEIPERQEIDTNKSFLNWYNSNYYFALYQLKLSEEEFFNLTVRELKTLVELHKNYNKNILLSAYIDVVKNKNTTDKIIIEKATVNNNVRIKDILER